MKGKGLLRPRAANFYPVYCKTPPPPFQKHIPERCKTGASTYSERRSENGHFFPPDDRAPGPDFINSQQLKYARDTVAKPIAHIIEKSEKASFKQHRPSETLGKAIYYDHPAKGQEICRSTSQFTPGSLCSSTTSKILSVIIIVVLRRIRNKTEHFTVPYQSGFKLFGHKAW